MTKTEMQENIESLIEQTSGQIRAIKWIRNVIRNQINREQKERVAEKYQQRKTAQIQKLWDVYDAVQRELTKLYEKLDVLKEDLKSFN